MGKTELAAIVREKTGCTHRAADEVIEGILSTISHNALNGEQVVIKGFGTFKRKERQGRMMYDPAKKSTKRVDGYVLLGFKAAPGMRFTQSTIPS